MLKYSSSSPILGTHDSFLNIHTQTPVARPNIPLMLPMHKSQVFILDNDHLSIIIIVACSVSC